MYCLLADQLNNEAASFTVYSVKPEFNAAYRGLDILILKNNTETHFKFSL